MSVFNSEHSKRRSSLQDAVSGLLHHADLTFNYTPDKPRTQAYVLPVDFIDGKLYGFFTMNGKTVETQLGFRQTKGLTSSKYYTLDARGTLKAGKKSANVVYLPLFAIADEANAGTGIFGVFGTKEKHPLVMVTPAESGFLCKGICYDGARVRLSEDMDFTSVARLEEILKTATTVPKDKKQAIMKTKVHEADDLDLKDPHAIVDYLDKYVIGQEGSKKSVAVAFSSYMARVESKDDDLPKPNLILIGPSGVGKTYMISLLAKKARLPFADAKITGKSAEGYVGENLSSVFKQIKAKSDRIDPYGIVFLDEIDKIAQTDDNGFDFDGQLQNELIGWLEEAIISAGDQKTQLNTKNLLFVTAGAFHEGDGLEGIIGQRLGSKQSLGFGTGAPSEPLPKDLLAQVMPEDLIEYGLKRELVGRLPGVAVFQPLTTEQMVRILTEAKGSALRRYAKVLEQKGYRIDLSQETHNVIVERCPKETGARALSSICYNLFTELIFRPEDFAGKDKTIHVTPELANSLITMYAAKKHAR